MRRRETQPRIGLEHGLNGRGGRLRAQFAQGIDGGLSHVEIRMLKETNQVRHRRWIARLAESGGRVHRHVVIVAAQGTDESGDTATAPACQGIQNGHAPGSVLASALGPLRFALPSRTFRQWRIGGRGTAFAQRRKQGFIEGLCGTRRFHQTVNVSMRRRSDSASADSCLAARLSCSTT